MLDILNLQPNKLSKDLTSYYTQCQEWVKRLGQQRCSLKNHVS